jgi:S1-C subfamily serine protease
VTLSAVPGTPADEAGLRGRSVVVTEVDDHELTGTMPDYCSATSGRRTGDRATLQVVSRRNGRPRRLALPFG